MYNRRAAFKKGGAFMSKYSDYMFQKHTKMFIELENTIEGLVHISTLKGDYFNYQERMLALIG